MSKNLYFAVALQIVLILTCTALPQKASGSKYLKNEGTINIIEHEPKDTPDDIAFFDDNGEKVFLDEFEGQTILLSFWATWCTPCLHEIADLEALQKDFRKLPFMVLPISEDFQGIKKIKNYFKSAEIRHLKPYHDYQNKLFKAFSVVGLPTSFLIDPTGKIVLLFSGTINWHDDAIRQKILSYIPGNPVTPKNSYNDQILNKKIKPQNIQGKGKQNDSIKNGRK